MWKIKIFFCRKTIQKWWVFIGFPYLCECLQESTQHTGRPQNLEGGWIRYDMFILVFSINMKNWPFLDDLPRKLLKKKTMFNGYVRLPVAMLFGGTDKWFSTWVWVQPKTLGFLIWPVKKDLETLEIPLQLWKITVFFWVNQRTKWVIFNSKLLNKSISATILEDPRHPHVASFRLLRSQEAK